MTTRRQVSIRIPEELYRQVRVKAAQTGRSVTEVLKEMLEKWVKEEYMTEKAK